MIKINQKDINYCIENMGLTFEWELHLSYSYHDNGGYIADKCEPVRSEDLQRIAPEKKLFSGVV